MPANAPPGRIPEVTTYGSDNNGMVWGFLFEEDRPPRQVDSVEAAELLQKHRDDDGTFLWLHFSLGNASTRRWLRDHLELPSGFYDALDTVLASTRLEQLEDSLVAVVHDVVFDFTFSPASASTVHICVQPGLLLSARPKPLRSLDRLRASARAGTRFRSPLALLAHLLRDQADVLVEIVRDATSRIDDIEDHILQRRVSVGRAELGELRRTLVRIQRLLAPEPAALFRLLNRPPQWFKPEDVDDLASAAEEFSAAVGDSAALVERMKLLQEEMVALINEQTNRTLFLLTLVTVLALPINLVAGLFGMNVGGIPLADASHGFAVVVVLVASSTLAAGLITLRMRRK